MIRRKIEAILMLIRPYAWLNTALPMLLASYIAVGSFEIRKLLPYFLVVGPLFWGGGYTLNDIIDHKLDSFHELKKRRPIPSGAISQREALIYAICSMALGLMLMFFLNRLAFFVMLLMSLSHILYTVPPFRTKTRKFFDLPFSGPLNSIFRLSIGWIAVSGISTLPPELLLMLFFLTCFIYLFYRSSDIQAFIKDGIYNSYSTLGSRRTIIISLLFLLLFYLSWAYASLYGFLSPNAILLIPVSAFILPLSHYFYGRLTRLPRHYFRQMYPATYTAYLMAFWHFVFLYLSLRISA